MKVGRDWVQVLVAGEDELVVAGEQAEGPAWRLEREAGGAKRRAAAEAVRRALSL